VTDHTPPNDEQAEAALLGHVLLAGQIPEGVNGLVPTDFYRPDHEVVWAAMQALTVLQHPCDAVAVRDHLRKIGKLDQPGGVSSNKVAELLGAPSVGQAGYVAGIIHELSQRRRLVELLTRYLQRAHEPGADIDEQLQRIGQDLGRISGHGGQYKFTTGGSFIFDTDPIPRALWGEGGDVLWPEGESLVIAGGQGLGKTTLAQQIVLGRIGIPGFAELLGYPIAPGGVFLYLAMDRPGQIARSFRRMVDEEHRALLEERLIVWKGPPPEDIAKHPELLLKLCRAAGADGLGVDSIKGAAIGLSDDEVGAGYNRARQLTSAGGVQVLELHHPRKAPDNKRAEVTLDDVYGSTWLTAGAGSVILLAGKAGDPIVGFRHVKPAAREVGPYQVLHSESGRSTIWRSVDLVELVQASETISAVDAAKALYDTDKPDPSEKEKARRALDKLVGSNELRVINEGDQKTNRPKLWAAK